MCYFCTLLIIITSEISETIFIVFSAIFSPAIFDAYCTENKTQYSFLQIFGHLAFIKQIKTTTQKQTLLCRGKIDFALYLRLCYRFDLLIYSVLTSLWRTTVILFKNCSYTCTCNIIDGISWWLGPWYKYFLTNFVNLFLVNQNWYTLVCNDFASTVESC
jgi:hypothetical protein